MILQVIEYFVYCFIDGYQFGDEEVIKFLDYYDFWFVFFYNFDGEFILSRYCLFFNEIRVKLLKFYRFCLYLNYRLNVVEELLIQI